MPFSIFPHHIFSSFAHPNSMIRKFLMCGVTGWCLEILWTALDSFRKRKLKLTGMTSVWMFPIYGCASFLSPLCRWMRSLPAIIRGSVYSVLILTGEFISGTLLSKKDMCPWDYSRARFNYRGVIRLDYFFVWFFIGLLYEKLLGKGGKRTSPRTILILPAERFLSRDRAKHLPPVFSFVLFFAIIKENLEMRRCYVGNLFCHHALRQQL